MILVLFPFYRLKKLQRFLRDSLQLLNVEEKDLLFCFRLSEEESDDCGYSTYKDKNKEGEVDSEASAEPVDAGDFIRDRISDQF